MHLRLISQLDIPVRYMSSHSRRLPVDSMANSVYSVATSAQHVHPWGQLQASAPNLPFASNMSLVSVPQMWHVCAAKYPVRWAVWLR